MAYGVTRMAGPPPDVGTNATRGRWFGVYEEAIRAAGTWIRVDFESSCSGFVEAHRLCTAARAHKTHKFSVAQRGTSAWIRAEEPAS